MKIWTLVTCIPGEAVPCIPEVFATESAAIDAFRKAMTGEWSANGPINENGEPLPIPDDPQEAHELMSAANDTTSSYDLWGEYVLTEHNV